MMLLFAPDWLTGFNFLVGLLGILIMVGVAMIILMSRRREDISLLETKRADANENLLKTRDRELEECAKRCEICNEELEAVTSEHRALAGVIIKDLMDYWQKRESELARIADLESQNRVLRIRLDKQGQ